MGFSDASVMKSKIHFISSTPKPSQRNNNAIDYEAALIHR